MSSLDEKVSELRVVQGQTHTLLKVLSDKVNSYVVADDERHKDIVEFRVESSRHLAEVATIVKDMKKDIDNVTDVCIPNLQTDNASTKATLKTHSWLIRAIVGVTFVAVLGGAVTSIATCEVSSPSKAEAAETMISQDADVEQ